MKKKLKISVVICLFVGLCLSIAEGADNPLKQMIAQGFQAYAQRNYQKAIAIFEKSIEVYPLAVAYNYTGLSYKELGTETPKVIGYFKKAIEADPQYAPAYENLGKVYYEKGDFDRAEEYGLKAVELRPDLLTAHLTLGWIYLVGKAEPDGAIEHFEKSLKSRNNAYALFGLGMARYMKNDNAQVLDIITRLRETGEEGFAIQLEKMMRSGSYTASKVAELTHFPFPKKKDKDVSESSFPVPIPSEAEARLKVQLKAENSNPPHPRATFPPQMPPAQSGADRIREYQKRGQSVTYDLFE